MRLAQRIVNGLGNVERRLRSSFGKDISTPMGRLGAHLHFQLFDHAFLRVFWTNFDEIAPGVFRSNQPSHRRLKRYRDRGIRTIVNLRGDKDESFYLFERESCEALGLKLVSVSLAARQAPRAERLLAVLDALRDAERPILFHCKSGADRAGVVAALYLIVFQGASVAEARRMLGLRYLHLKFTRTGIQDYFLDVFEARLACEPVDFETWLTTEYDREMLGAGFARRQPPAELAEAMRRQARPAAEARAMALRAGPGRPETGT